MPDIMPDIMPDGVCNPVRNLYLIPGRSLGTGTTVQKNASLNFCTPDFIMPDGVCNPVRQSAKKRFAYQIL